MKTEKYENGYYVICGDNPKEENIIGPYKTWSKANESVKMCLKNGYSYAYVCYRKNTIYD